MLHLLAEARALGAWAPLAYVGLYTAVVAAMLPAWPLTIAAGALFGFWRGIGLSFTGATLGSTLAFLIARHGGRRYILRWFGQSRSLAALDLAVGREGRRMVFLMRLSPFVPFNIVNYLLGLTGIAFIDYVLAAPGMLPVTIVYTYAGFAAGEALALSGEAAVPHTTSYYVLLALGLAATIAVTVVVTRAARRAIIDVTL